MRVLIAEPGKPAAVTDIDNDLKTLQKTVGGYIETVTLNDDIVLIVNEEGKLRGLPECRTLVNLDGGGMDTLVGTVIVAGIDWKTGSFCSLTDEQAAELKRKFDWPMILIN